MKRLVLGAATLAILVPCSVRAADCSYEQNEIDLFTKARVIRTEWDQVTSWKREVLAESLFDHSSAIFVAAVADGDSHYLAVKVRYSWTTEHDYSVPQLREAFVVPEGAYLEFELDDGSTVDVYAEKTVEGKTRKQYHGSRYLLTSTAEILYPLEAAMTEALTGRNARVGRLTYNLGQLEFRFDNKSHGDVRKAIQCLEVDA